MPANPLLKSSIHLARQITSRSGSTFGIGFRLLPRDQADAMHVLYAFCRLTDDIADLSGTSHDKEKRLNLWKSQLDEALSGHAAGDLFPALLDVVNRYKVNPAFLHDQIRGAAWDIAARPIHTWDDLREYCDLVATSVGRACLAIWGCTNPLAMEPSLAAGRALQLTNILRDLAEDRDRGRVYLPREELTEFECPPDRWSASDPNFQRLMTFQAERVKSLFAESDALLPLLPKSGRRVFRVFRDRYRAILDEIIRRKFDVFSARVRPGHLTTLRIVGRALLTR